MLKKQRGMTRGVGEVAELLVENHRRQALAVHAPLAASHPTTHRLPAHHTNTYSLSISRIILLRGTEVQTTGLTKQLACIV